MNIFALILRPFGYRRWRLSCPPLALEHEFLARPRDLRRKLQYAPVIHILPWTADALAETAAAGRDAHYSHFSLVRV